MNPKVEQFLSKQKRWKDEITLMRDIILDIKELDEDYKWMIPCYTLQDKNVVVIQAFQRLLCFNVF